MRIAFTVADPDAAAREERLICVPQGEVKYMLLLEDVQAQYRRLGNHHWGTQFDVNNLSQALGVGILMFCDDLQAGGQECLYNIGAQREDFPYWVALWWKEPVHFRVATVSYGAAPTRGTCFWPNASLPNLLRQQYQRCNRLAN